MNKPWLPLQQHDPELFQLCERELTRQREGLELIASENFVSPQLLASCANAFTNKYAEGLPGRRYYGGCGVTDELENLAINRAKELFKAEFANVQLHSGHRRTVRHSWHWHSQAIPFSVSTSPKADT